MNTEGSSAILVNLDFWESPVPPETGGGWDHTFFLALFVPSLSFSLSSA